MKVRADTHQLRWDSRVHVAPGSPGHTTGPSHPSPSHGAGDLEREHPC